jgi:hypothetical protein
VEREPITSICRCGRSCASARPFVANAPPFCAHSRSMFAHGPNGSTVLPGRTPREARAHPKGLDLSCIVSAARSAQASPMSFDRNAQREKPMHADIASNSQQQFPAVKSLWSHYCEKLAAPKRLAVIPCAAGPAVGRREALRIWAALAPEACTPLFQLCQA